MKRLLIAFLVLFSLSSKAATNTAASASRTDVAAALVGLGDGDAVLVPAGTQTWSSPITITHGITVIGAGTNSTIITGRAFVLQPASNKLPRITKFQFAQSDWSTEPIISVLGFCAQFRVDHCLFIRGKKCILTGDSSGSGPVFGLVDHCRLLDCDNQCLFIQNNETGEGSIQGIAEYNKGFSGTNAPGTTNMVVVEDCWWTLDSALTGDNNNQIIYLEYGGKGCFRHNRIDCVGGTPTWYDCHGMNGSGGVGGILSEVYSNTVSAAPADYGFIFIRGGTHFFYGNTVSDTAGSYSSAIQLNNEEFGPWPYGNVTNCFFWDNTYNGSAWTAPLGDRGTPYSSPGALGVTYFMHAPNAGNNFYPYTPLVYPHPLVTALDNIGSSTYYASPSGSSGNNGLSPFTPWPLDYAITHAGNSNTIVCLPGLYTYSSTLNITNSYLTIMCSPKWGAVFTNITGVHPFYPIAPAHDLTFDGLSFQNNQYDVLLGDQSNPSDVYNVTFRNCWCRGTGNDTGRWGTSSSASGVETVCAGGILIENCLMESNGVYSASFNHGIYAGGTNGIYRNNICRYNGGAGIIVNGHGVVFDDKNQIYNNLVYYNNAQGYEIAIKDSGSTGSNYVFGNTVIEPGHSYAVIFEANTHVFYTNNITISTGNGIDALGTVRADYNVAPATLAVSGPHDVITNYYGFVNANAGLYWLKSDSPVRGKALATVLGPVDFFGTNQATAADIGAFQYSALFTNDARVLDPSGTYPDYWANSGSSGPAPVIQVTPTLYDFGATLTNTTLSTTFSISNVGTGTLTGTGTVAAPFAIGSVFTYSLTAGTGTNLTVKFTPTTGGSFSNAVVWTGGGSQATTVLGSAPTVQGLSFGASNGIVSAPFLLAGDSSVYQPGLTADPSVGGQLLCYFYVAASGDYVMTNSVDAPADDANSFFLQIDSQPNGTNVWAPPVNVGFINRGVTWGAATNATLWNLTQGVHELIVRGREGGTYLMSVNLSQVSAPPPPPAPPVIYQIGTGTVGSGKFQ